MSEIEDLEQSEEFQQEPQQERKFTYHVFVGACMDCLPWAGLEFGESQISSLFPFAERVTDQSWIVNRHPNCYCTLETEDYSELIDMEKYNLYWSQGEEDSFSSRKMMRAVNAIRSPESAASFGIQEAIKQFLPEMAPMLIPFLMPLLTVAFQEIAKYQAYLETMKMEEQRSKVYREVYRAGVSE